MSEHRHPSVTHHASRITRNRIPVLRVRRTSMENEWMLNRRELLVTGAGFVVAGAAGLLRIDPSWAADSLSPSTLVTEPYVVVETANGKVRGGHSRGALAFKGIPYAGPVTGANRFKAAPPVESWTGIRDALALGTP